MTRDTMRLGSIGGGKMAEAILAACVSADVVKPANLCVSDISAERREHLAGTYGLQAVEDNAAVLQQATTVLLAVKPQQLDEVLAGIAAHQRPEHLFVSIAAGKRLAYFAERLPGARVVRVMPNLAALIGQSASAFCMGDACTAEDAAVARTLLDAFGVTVELPEEQFDVVTALCGSGPAFLAHVLESMVQGAVAQGVPEADARTLAYQTARGTAELLIQDRFSPESLIAAVSSAKGTTVAGMEVLRASTVAADLARTLEAAANRSRELSR